MNESDMKLAVLKAEDTLYKYLPGEDGYARTVASAMNYSVRPTGFSAERAKLSNPSWQPLR